MRGIQVFKEEGSYTFLYNNQPATLQVATDVSSSENKTSNIMDSTMNRVSKSPEREVKDSLDQEAEGVKLFYPKVN